MENGAYYDDDPSCKFHETPRAPLRKFIRPTELFRMDSSSNPDSHIYEDITSSASNPTSSPFRTQHNNSLCLADNELFLSQVQNTNRLPNYYSNSEIDHDSLNSFHRNLTLPLRRTNPLTKDENLISSSVRVTSRERIRAGTSLHNNDSSIIDENYRYSSGPINIDVHNDQRNHGRRRRKKDCKHCKNRTNSGFSTSSSIEVPVDVSCSNERFYDDNNDFRLETEKSILGIIEPIFTMPEGRLPSFCNNSRCEKQLSSVYCISNNVNCSAVGSGNVKTLNYDKNDIEARLAHVEGCEDKALITPPKNRAGMKVNSIYAQEHWHTKDVPIFLTDAKEQSSFQRANSLPVRTHTPTSENRVNLRRSVRGEPPPHPARLRKHPHGWTLHFARPLTGPSGCTRSIVLLLIVILALLGIGGIALYIVFEPQKLQIIQQYLRSSGRNVSTSENFTSFTSGLEHLIDEQNVSTDVVPTLPVGVLLNASLSFPEANEEPTETETEVYSSTTTTTTITSTTIEAMLDLNSTRHCDDCFKGEVCVALVGEEVPICRTGPDPLDPTGCSGLCLINKQKCHRLDIDAFRCMDLEHYCLDDEWTCKNSLCIPLVKHCDGTMNCYDHSDEYNCECNLETHFQCGNETSCLPLDKKCDGKIDCWDATDEINCTLACPLESEFTCNDGQCILKARFCDGLRDCVDGSDEPHGCQGRCNKHEFTCQNGRCITKNLKCNGIDDCGDGTDEQLCRDRT
ncbi:uncharacterized protein LOC127283717 isoform X2 [Leptopilina boulardi]|nr:uncharacterized protein LOC127283717 isoform X2 [Leptopilina boulardi]